MGFNASTPRFINEILPSLNVIDLAVLTCYSLLLEFYALESADKMRTACDLNLQYLIVLFVPVQDVVLNDEEDVEDDGKQAEAELGRIAEDRSPVIWK